MAGDQLLFVPGDEVPVDLQDQGNGLPSRGDVVEITGEDAQLTTCGIVNNQGDEGIGVVTDVKSDVDGNAVAGPGTIALFKPVVIVSESSQGALSAGDLAQEDAGGGVIDYSGAASPTETPLGQVFAAEAGKYGYGKSQEVAVALWR